MHTHVSYITWPHIRHRQTLGAWIRIARIGLFTRDVLRAFHPHFQAVNALAGGDEEEATILATESDIVGPGFRHVDVFDLLACLVEDGDAAPSQIHIAFLV